MSNQPERDPERRVPAAVGTAADAPVRREATQGTFHATFNFEGHHVIALVMKADLKGRSERTLARVEEILRNGDRTLLDAPTFPDAIRNQQPQIRPFHFIDIRFVQGGPAEPLLPDPPNVLSEIVPFTGVLQSPGASAVHRLTRPVRVRPRRGSRSPADAVDKVPESHGGTGRRQAALAAYRLSNHFRNTLA